MCCRYYGCILIYLQNSLIQHALNNWPCILGKIITNIENSDCHGNSSLWDGFYFYHCYEDTFDQHCQFNRDWSSIPAVQHSRSKSDIKLGWITLGFPLMFVGHTQLMEMVYLWLSHTSVLQWRTPSIDGHLCKTHLLGCVS